MEMGYIAGRRQSTLLPPALALLARTLPLSHRGAPVGVDPGRAENWPTANWPTPPACSLPDDRPRKRSARMAHRELASVPGHHCPRPFAAPPLVRPLPRSPPVLPSPPANWPTLAPPRSPRSPIAVGAGSRPPWPTAPRAHAHAHACLLWPSSLRRPRGDRGLRGWGGRLQRFPSSSVAVELRPPPRGPVTLPQRRPAHRASHRLSGPRRPPLVRANAPVSGDDSQGEGFRTKCGPPGLEHPSQLANWQAHCLPSV